MTALTFAEVLREAADDLGVMPRQEVVALLRRAALRIENTPSGLNLEPIFEEALAEVAAELDLSRGDAIKGLLCDWFMAKLCAGGRARRRRRRGGERLAQ